MTRRRYVILGLVTLALAAGVRLVAATNEFWLDEIWSLFIAVDLGTAWQAFTVKHDNNHVHNTLYLRWVGLHDAWLVYRLPAVLSGTATAALVLVCERPERRPDALAAALLIALSYPLVLYSAEARGYAPALLCALASFYAVDRYWTHPALAPLLVFWASAVAGVLFHATYLQAYLALLGWSVVQALYAHGVSARAATTLLVCQALPAALLGTFYVVFVRGMTIGGGPGYRTLDVVRETAAYTLGMPQPMATAALAVTAVITVVGLALLLRQRAARAVPFALVLTVVPALALAISQPTVLYFRYFLVQIVFFYLLAGAVLASLWRRGALGRGISTALLLLFVAGQLPSLRALLTTGRGGCVETIRYLGAHTAGAEVVVGSDQDFRNQLMLWYFARFLPSGKALRYVAQSAWPAGGPEWVLAHDLGPPTPKTPGIQDARGNRYDQVAGFQCGGVARWYWWVYRRATTPSAVPPALAPSPAARPFP